MDALNDTLPFADTASLATALARPAAPGHFDELRGHAMPDGAAPVWSDFFEHLGPAGLQDLDRRMHSLQRQVRDNGITYNVYADAGGPQRPWSVDLFPLILDALDWSQIEAGVLQRVRLLEGLMADVYGPQELLQRGLLPSALVQGHPGYLRPMHGVQPVGGMHLHIAAFDLARDAQGDWCVVSQRTQAPSGLGYLLENRLLVSRLFPEVYGHMHVQRLAATYRALLDGLRRMCPEGADARIVLLTPGPYNETYFEHAYLARYLGLPLVEGNDLTVRDARLYLKTLHGLQPVHGILKRLDDEFLDPLELRPDSRLGVPGLLQAIRAGNVLVANAPGSAWLESSALLGFMPALARDLLGEELLLPALPTWWCGEEAAMLDVLPRLAQSVIRPTWPSPQGMTVLGRTLEPRQLQEWADRIQQQGDAYTVQAYMPLSQMPTWRAQRVPGDAPIVPRSVMLRVLAVSDGPQSWRVLPGGLARIATDEREIASMQRGGSSADVWVQTAGPVDGTTLLPHGRTAPAVVQRSRQVTSRAAENLFWLGRYTERAENTARLARIALQSCSGEEQASRALLAWVDALAVEQGMVQSEPKHRVLEHALIVGLSDANTPSVGYNLGGVHSAASAVRDRLSQAYWNLIERAHADFLLHCRQDAVEGGLAPLEAMHVLDVLLGRIAAMTGEQSDRMTRDDGWRMMSVGRYLERLGFFSNALAKGLETGAVFVEDGFEAMLALFDSTITFHAQYQQRRDLSALLDLLLLDNDNPRSLAWVARTVRGRVAKIEAAATNDMSVQPAEALVPDVAGLTLQALCARDANGQHSALLQHLYDCRSSAWRLSDLLATRYFTHAADAARHSVGA